MLQWNTEQKQLWEKEFMTSFKLDRAYHQGMPSQELKQEPQRKLTDSLSLAYSGAHEGTTHSEPGALHQSATKKIPNRHDHRSI